MQDPRKTKELPFMVQYLFCNEPLEFINFIESVLDAKEVRERTMDEGKIVNAMYLIAGNLYEISIARGDFVQVIHSFHLYTPMLHEIVEKAQKYGCDIKQRPTSMDYGDEEAWFIDPFGNNWFTATPLDRI